MCGGGGKEEGNKDSKSGFYTRLNVWGSLGLNFDCDGGPIIENGGPIFLEFWKVVNPSVKGFEQALAVKHHVIFVFQPFEAT